MISKKDFDGIIKRNIVKTKGESVLGYDSYENYYSRAEFEKFKTEMQRPEYLDFYNRYKAGKGSELEPRKESSGRFRLKWQVSHLLQDSVIWLFVIWEVVL